VTMPGDFEHDLRQGLATLAREAVPEAPASLSTLTPMRSNETRRERRFAPRWLAAGIAIAVATASVVVALSVHGGSHTPPVQPSPEWTKVAPFPLEPRSSQVAVFTGRDLIVWGGRSDAAGNVTPAQGPGTPRYSLGDGAAYDIATDHWQVLPRAPIAGRYEAVAAWTGTEMLVVGGQRDHAGPQGSIGFLRDGGAFDPLRRHWRRIADAPGCPMFGTWTGTRLVVGGTCADVAGAPLVLAAYDPARDRWTRLPRLASARELVAAGGRVYAWDAATGRGAVLDPATQHWRALRRVPGVLLEDSLALSYEHRLAVIGRQRGSDGGPDLGAFYVFDPRAQTWTGAASRIGSPLGGSAAAAAPGAVVWSGFGLSSVSTDPALRSVALANVKGAPIDLQTSGQSIVAIGYRRFFIWGGRLAGTQLDPTNRPTADGAIVQLP